MLRTLRKRAGFSDVDVAREMGVTRGTIQRWENGSRVPRLPDLARYLDVLGATEAERLEVLRAAVEPEP